MEVEIGYLPKVQGIGLVSTKYRIYSYVSPLVWRLQGKKCPIAGTCPVACLCIHREEHMGIPRCIVVYLLQSTEYKVFIQHMISTEIHMLDYFPPYPCAWLSTL